MSRFIVTSFTEEEWLLHHRYYRWWKISGWWWPHDRGLKLGPLSVASYRASRWRWGLYILGRTVYDSGIRALQRGDPL